MTACILPLQNVATLPYTEARLSKMHRADRIHRLRFNAARKGQPLTMIEASAVIDAEMKSEQAVAVRVKPLSWGQRTVGLFKRSVALVATLIALMTISTASHAVMYVSNTPAPSTVISVRDNYGTLKQALFNNTQPVSEHTCEVAL